RELHEHRDAGASGVAERAADRGHEPREPRRRLQVAQAGRVRRAHVDREVVGEGRERGDRAPEVGELGVRVADRGARAADVDADRDRRAAREATAKAGRDRLRTRAVEAEAIHERAVRGEAEEPRRRIPRLRESGHGPELGEAEAERLPKVGRDAVLVEARGEPDRVREVEPEDPLPEVRPAPGRVPGRDPLEDLFGERGGGDGAAMGALGVEREERGLEEAVEAAHAPASRTSSWPPLSSAASSSYPPIDCPAMKTWGTVRRPPVRFTRRARSSGSWVTSTSWNATPFRASSDFAAWQYGQ